MIALFQANTKIVEMYFQQLVRTNTFLILHRLCRDTFVCSVQLFINFYT
jgi:hypothetical protein